MESRKAEGRAVYDVLSDIIDRLDELIIAAAAAGTGGFIGGWMALRAAKASIDRSTQAGREERAAAATERRRLVLVALEAELRPNAALPRSERDGGSPVAPAWRIPFRDAYVAALPYLSSLPAPIQAALQDSAVLGSHYTVVAEGHTMRGWLPHGVSRRPMRPPGMSR